MFTVHLLMDDIKSCLQDLHLKVTVRTRNISKQQKMSDYLLSVMKHRCVFIQELVEAMSCKTSVFTVTGVTFGSVLRLIQVSVEDALSLLNA